MASAKSAALSAAFPCEFEPGASFQQSDSEVPLVLVPAVSNEHATKILGKGPFKTVNLSDSHVCASEIVSVQMLPGPVSRQVQSFFPNASRRVLVLRLGVWGLGVYAKSVRSVRKHSQASASVRKRARPKIAAKRRTVVTFGLGLGFRVSKVSRVTGIGGVLVAKRRIVLTFGLVLGLRVSKVSTVTGIEGVLVAKRRTVVTIGRRGEGGEERRGEEERREEERREMVREVTEIRDKKKQRSQLREACRAQLGKKGEVR